MCNVYIDNLRVFFCCILSVFLVEILFCWPIFDKAIDILDF